jgi:hypothetical protein
MTKTPYEIRLELVKLAKEMLSEEYNNQHSDIQREWDANCAKAMDIKSNIPPRPIYPKYFTEDDVLNKAARLNEFISNGK